MLRRLTFTISVMIFGAILLPSLPLRAADRVVLNYQVTVPAALATKGLKLFIPLAGNSSDQIIYDRKIRISHQEDLIFSAIREEGVYGNTYWFGQLKEQQQKKRKEPFQLEVQYEFQRKELNADLSPLKAMRYSKEELQRWAIYLKPNMRVPVDGPIISQLKAKLSAQESSPLQRAQEIYDYVLANMEYKKVGTGWGHGDTHWACSRKFGNCTDFHALFTSLARSYQIPSRFEIGFPIPEKGEGGQIQGYHCWLQFYLPGRGWVPVDASEAKKNPEKRLFYFGNMPKDRLMFSKGRDLRLGKEHRGKPLNYFVFPYAERGQQEVKVDLKVTYQTADSMEL